MLIGKVAIWAAIETADIVQTFSKKKLLKTIIL